LAAACTSRITGVAYLSASSGGTNATPQATIAASSTGISTIMPRMRCGASAAASRATLAPNDVPRTTASSSPRWSMSAIVCSPNAVIE
jgi:hypothetical protein